jgi:triacylglycerol lipase|tara:strand:+ start:1643 stop:2488 length:846 start_codon:yes stop_codon:yes gene_type:complete
MYLRLFHIVYETIYKYIVELNCIYLNEPTGEPMNTKVEFCDVKSEAILKAEMAKIAYEDGPIAKKHFKDLGYTGHKFIDHDGAQAHCVWNKEEFVLCCRGTEPTEFNDLKADLNIWPDKAQVGGWVHNGFQTEIDDIWEDIMAVVGKQLKNRKLSICGHSLGGAMATIAGSRLMEHKPVLYTFGSPRVGNSTFVKECADLEHYRFVNNNDLVTVIPPWFMGYRHHGQVMYFNYNGIIKNLAWWRKLKDKLTGILTSWIKLKPFDGLTDHSMDNYTKYTKDN